MSEVMNHWPQYVLLGVHTLLFAVAVTRHGETKKPTERITWLNALTGFLVVNFVLYKGGFYAPIGFAP